MLDVGSIREEQLRLSLFLSNYRKCRPIFLLEFELKDLPFTDGRNLNQTYRVDDLITLIRLAAPKK